MEISRHTANPADVALGLAHELFHEWNARRLNRPEDERLYWFSEGVTDYYAAMTLWRSGIWDFQRVLKDFNERARQYFGSSVRNYTADRMAEQRKTDFNAERLPYLQGYLLAAHWNPDGEKLDQAMRNLLKTNRGWLSNMRIAEALIAAGVQNAASEIERFIVRGETIELRPRIWGECTAESVLDVKQFDIGFDLEASRKTGTIRGTRENSNAWRAGVRDGQQWSPIDIVWGDPDYLAEFEVRDGQGTRRVKYYPASSPVQRAPQYTAIRQCFPSRASRD